MRVLWFNCRDVCNPSAGGAEVYTHEIARRLVSWGHDVTLFSSFFPGCVGDEVVDGVRVVRRGGRFSVYFYAFDFFRCSSGFDVVVDEINTLPFFTPLYVDVPVVALIHQLAREFWFYEVPFPFDRVGYFLEDDFLGWYVDVPTVTVSDSSASDLEDIGFGDVRVVHNGLNVSPVSSVPDKTDYPSIVFVGRMKRAKRPGDVLEAFKIVRGEVDDAVLSMIGDGYLRDRLDCPEGCTFLGYASDALRDSCVMGSWVIAVPGVREGWGQVVTDANGLGTPAVGYDIPGLRDSICDGVNGLLVDPDPVSLASGLLDVISSGSLRSSLSEGALEYSRGFGWDASAEDFLGVLRGVVGG